jgi:hypothetical protein
MFLEQKFLDERGGCGLFCLGAVLFVITIPSLLGGNPFSITACIYDCGLGYLAVVSLAIMAVGLYFAYRKRPPG